ncbi:MAG: gephyrin-like molybdotransferase Glp [Bacillota bacterium]
MRLFQVRTVEEAVTVLRRYANVARPSRVCPLAEALGLAVARDILAPEDVPGFDRSTMDGFAVRASDTFGASEGLPAYLEVVGEVRMGEAPATALSPGQACRIATGGMLPAGADAVVMVEHTETVDERTVGVTRPVAPGENTVRRGDDIRAGEVLFAAGHRLRPQDVGLLAAAGVAEVPVLAPPRVGIITTGDEIVPVEQTPGPGQVRDVNSYTNAGLVAACGGVPVRYGIVRDDFDALYTAASRALAETDMVVVSGGSSVGTRDMTARVIDALGEPGVLFHGLAVRPGKPTIGAVVAGKPVIGLPGHPVSAMVVFDLIVRPLINPGERRLAVRARVSRQLRSAPGREDYVRVRLRRENGELVAEPILGKSGLIATMARADGLAVISLDSGGVEAGECVDVLLF